MEGEKKQEDQDARIEKKATLGTRDETLTFDAH